MSWSQADVKGKQIIFHLEAVRDPGRIGFDERKIVHLERIIQVWAQ